MSLKTNRTDFSTYTLRPLDYELLEGKDRVSPPKPVLHTQQMVGKV